MTAGPSPDGRSRINIEPTHRGVNSFSSQLQGAQRVTPPWAGRRGRDELNPTFNRSLLAFSGGHDVTDEIMTFDASRGHGVVGGVCARFT